MIDTNKRYTLEERNQLQGLGYEFIDFTLTTDSQPMFVVSRYNPPSGAPGPQDTVQNEY